MNEPRFQPVADPRKAAATLVLVLLVLPCGLGAVALTVFGIGNLADRDAVAQDFGIAMLVGALIGWVLCTLLVMLWRRLRGGRSGGQPEAP
jgi:hypothetical protein